MVIPKHDALALLSKWKNEQTWVSGIWALNDGGVVFGGCIEILEAIGLRISHHVTATDKAVEINFRLDHATTFEYQDLREADPATREKLGGAVESLLSIHTGSSRLALCEMTGPLPMRSQFDT